MHDVRGCRRERGEGVVGSYLVNSVHSNSLHGGIWKVLTKFGKSKMSSVEFTAATKGALRALVERETARTGSRTVAYEIVSQTIGASPSWIRIFLAGDDAVREPRISLFQNIKTSYNNLCVRVEQEQQAELMKLAQIRRDIDAVTAGLGQALEAAQGTESGGEAPETTSETERWS